MSRISYKPTGMEMRIVDVICGECSTPMVRKRKIGTVFYAGTDRKPTVHWEWECRKCGMHFVSREEFLSW